MCIDVRKTCECGTNTVQFHLRDNVLLPEVISRLFCPSCPGDTGYNEATMLHDNGWTIEYDMVLAKMLIAQKLVMDPEQVGPEFIFDGGYASWLEMYPGEREEIKEERDKIIALLKEDQKKYLQTIQQWNIGRIQRLKSEGWRKAQLA